MISRWEWRTFGADLGPAESRILSNGEARAWTSAETYIISRDSARNTKIRDGFMDIKKLEALDAGLERWNPVLKAGLPLDAAVLGKIFAAWNVVPPDLARGAYTLEQFLPEIVRPHPRLAAIAVEEERFGFTIGGCIVEVAHLKFDGTPIRTAAVEAEDPLAVLQTVRKLGLDGFENVNYVKALKRFQGLTES